MAHPSAQQQNDNTMTSAEIDRDYRQVELIIKLEQDYLRCCEILRDAERDQLHRTVDSVTRNLDLLDTLLQRVVNVLEQRPSLSTPSAGTPNTAIRYTHKPLQIPSTV